MPQVSPETNGDPRTSTPARKRARNRRRLRVLRRPPLRHPVLLRIAVPRFWRRGIRLRIAKPLLPGVGRRAHAAILAAPGELSLAVVGPGRNQGMPKQFSCRLPPGYIVSAIHAGNVREREAVAFALRALWNHARVSKRKLGALSVIIPDQCVRMTSIPLAGPAPAPAEGDAMARWALRDLLPGDGGDFRVDWAMLTGIQSPEERWLFALAAASDLVREYEEVAERLGMSVGRVVPVSLAVAAGSPQTAAHEPGTARLVLCGTGRLPAALLEADGIPRAHRAWRGQPVDLRADLAAIDAHARNRLGLRVAAALIAGPPRWCAKVAAICTDLGWQASVTTRWAAHRGALR